MRGGQSSVGEVLAVRTLEDRDEPAAVVVLTLVEAEHLLVQVGVEVERSRGDIGTAQRPLQARPEVLDMVRVNAALDVRDGVVNDFVLILTLPRTSGRG